jgi:hypothetical protein
MSELPETSSVVQQHIAATLNSMSAQVMPNVPTLPDDPKALMHMLLKRKGLNRKQRRSALANHAKPRKTPRK